MRNQNQSLKTNRLLIVILVLVVLILVLLGFIATQFFTSSEEETTQSSQLLSSTTETSASTTDISETSVSSTTLSEATTTPNEETVTNENNPTSDFPYSVSFKPNTYYTSFFGNTKAFITIRDDWSIFNVRIAETYMLRGDPNSTYKVNQSFMYHNEPTKEIRVIVGNGEKTVKVNTTLDLYNYLGFYDELTQVFFSKFNTIGRRDSYLYTTNQGYVAIAFPVDDPGLYEEFILTPDKKE